MLDPCNICGSDVRLRDKRLPGTLGQPQGEVIQVRVCTNRSCRSNTRQMTLADRV